MLTRYAERHLTWVDAVDPTAKEVRELMAEFELDPRVAEELTSPSPKSKAERHDEHLYLVLHFPALRAMHSRPEQEIDFVIGKNFLITARYAHIDPLHFFAKSFEVGSVLGRGHDTHGGHLFVAMVQSLYRSLLSECDALRERLDETEERIFKGREREMVAQISTLGRMIHDFRRTLEPHKQMLESLEPTGVQLFGQGFGYHIRRVLGEYERVRQSLDHLRDWLSELRETNNSLLTTKQNDIMKTFTVLTFFFLPLSFIAGLFGMNTVNNPIAGHPYDFWIVGGIMTVLGIFLITYFKRKDWL